jgi:hypothetical protein
MGKGLAINPTKGNECRTQRTLPPRYKSTSFILRKGQITMENQEKLSILQAATYVKKNPETIRRWIREKKVVAKRDELGRWTILKSDLDEYLKEKE